MLEIMALRAPVSPRPLAVTPERAAWLQRVAFALQVLLAARSDIPRPMAVSPERAASAPQVNRYDTVGSTATCCCWLRIWRICDAAAALLFAADAVVVDAAAAAAASRSDGRPTDEGVLPECGGELDHFVSAKCAAWMYRMRRSSTFGKGARWVCALSLAGRAGCGAGSGIQTLPPL